MSNEFWAAIWGAVVGSVLTGTFTGGASWWLQKQNLRAAKDEREAAARQKQQALALALLYKLIQITSHLDICAGHLIDSAAKAKVDVKDLTPEIVLPLANYPSTVTFSTDELSMLLGLGDVDVFNMVASLDEVHNSIVHVWVLYSAKRELLLRLLVRAQSLQIDPETPVQKAETDSILAQLKASALRDVSQAHGTLTAYNRLVAEKLSIRVPLVLKETSATARAIARAVKADE